MRSKYIWNMSKQQVFIYIIISWRNTSPVSGLRIVATRDFPSGPRLRSPPNIIATQTRAFVYSPGRYASFLIDLCMLRKVYKKKKNYESIANIAKLNNILDFDIAMRYPIRTRIVKSNALRLVWLSHGFVPAERKIARFQQMVTGVNFMFAMSKKLISACDCITFLPQLTSVVSFRQFIPKLVVYTLWHHYCHWRRNKFVKYYEILCIHCVHETRENTFEL